jgi:hypothetical protein
VAGGTFGINEVIMLCAIIIGVVICCGVAGLTDPVPRFIIPSKGEVCRTLLENRKVKGTVNVPCFFPDEA